MLWSGGWYCVVVGCVLCSDEVVLCSGGWYCVVVMWCYVVAGWCCGRVGGVV